MTARMATSLEKETQKQTCMKVFNDTGSTARLSGKHLKTCHKKERQENINYVPRL